MRKRKTRKGFLYRLRVSFLLIVPVVLLVLLGIQPVERENIRRGIRMTIEDDFRESVDSALALIQFSDVIVEEPTVPAATEETTVQESLIIQEPEPVAAATQPSEEPTEPQATEEMPEQETVAALAEQTEKEETVVSKMDGSIKQRTIITTGKVPVSQTVPEETAEPETEPETEPITEPETEPITEPETEPPVFQKHYRINDAMAAAPMPDPSLYGEAATAAEMAAILEAAEPVLEGQDLLFNTELELMRDSDIHYYLDETIFAVVWKQKIHGAVFTFAEVKLMDATQFRRYLSGGQFGSGKLTLTSEMSRSVNAVVGCSADYYAYRYEGLTVVDGIVEKCKPGVPANCFIDDNGDLLLEPDMVFNTIEEAQAYVDEHHVNFSLSFGPVLVKDGEPCCPRDYRMGEVYGNFPRAAICQMDKLHYLFVVSNKENYAANMLTMHQFAVHIAETGCVQAYALDGGQTATVVMDNVVRNHVNYGSERPVSDIIYFATAKPMEEGNT